MTSPQRQYDGALGDAADPLMATWIRLDAAVKERLFNNYTPDEADREQKNEIRTRYLNTRRKAYEALRATNDIVLFTDRKVTSS